ncbi:MAG: hypothetical protein OCC49_17700 [Fibrobacterales bacterium]
MKIDRVPNIQAVLTSSCPSIPMNSGKGSSRVDDERDIISFLWEFDTLELYMVVCAGEIGTLYGISSPSVY